MEIALEGVFSEIDLQFEYQFKFHSLKGTAFLVTTIVTFLFGK